MTCMTAVSRLHRPKISDLLSKNLENILYLYLFRTFLLHFIECFHFKFLSYCRCNKYMKISQISHFLSFFSWYFPEKSPNFIFYSANHVKIWGKNREKYSTWFTEPTLIMTHFLLTKPSHWFDRLLISSWLMGKWRFEKSFNFPHKLLFFHFSALLYIKIILPNFFKIFKEMNEFVYPTIF